MRTSFFQTIISCVKSIDRMNIRRCGRSISQGKTVKGSIGWCIFRWQLLLETKWRTRAITFAINPDSEIQTSSEHNKAI